VGADEASAAGDEGALGVQHLARIADVVPGQRIGTRRKDLSNDCGALTVDK
jgi:hypothetical protein